MTDRQRGKKNQRSGLMSWIRENMRPLIVGAVIGAVISAPITALLNPPIEDWMWGRHPRTQIFTSETWNGFVMFLYNAGKNTDSLMATIDTGGVPIAGYELEATYADEVRRISEEADLAAGICRFRVDELWAKQEVGIWLKTEAKSPTVEVTSEYSGGVNEPYRKSIIIVTAVGGEIGGSS